MVKKGLVFGLSALLLLSAGAAVVGVGSNGFKNWNPNTWFNDENSDEKIGGVVSLDEDDKIHPVLFKVNNLATTEDTGVIDMSNVVITATTDGSIEPCDKFVFSFSEDVSRYCTYETTENTITVHFTRKPGFKIYLYATTTGSTVSHRGSLGIDFTKDMKGIGLYGVSDTGISCDVDYTYMELDLYSVFANNVEFLDFEDAISYDPINGSIGEPVVLSYTFDSEYDIFAESFNDKKLYFNLNEPLLEEIYGNSSYQGEGYVVLGEFEIIVNGLVSETVKSHSFEVRILKKNIVDGGVDMGGDIIVGQ